MAIPAPGGVVTFVFTDIEGSTRLFHRLGDEYVELLDRHHSLLRAVWKRHDGFEVSTEGDSFFVAFSTADHAVTACADAQRRLAAEPWPEKVRVRMGVHTGVASLHEGGYVALAVHQAARLTAAAHGEQVLVSQATSDALEAPDGLLLRLLGRYRLKDFDEPQNVYQLTGDGLRDSFPAVRAVPAEGHNITRRPTATVGRSQLIESLSDHVQAGRLLTLLGPGGVGKTRVAEEVGVRVSPDWPDGVWLVNLAGVAGDDLVAPAVADAVGAPNRPGRERRDDLVDHLRAKRAVVILDDCEDLLGACGRLVSALQSNCSGVAVLATSREPIHIAGESLWRIEPLETPASGRSKPSIVLASPAGRLFAERAGAARPGFVIDESNAEVVGEICRRLDGLPLSIELAAALVAVQSPPEILQGLSDRFRLLRARNHTIDPRHQSVEGLLTWSYDSLTSEEQRLFRFLSIFSSSFSTETAAATTVPGGEDALYVAPVLWSLVDRSLVESDLSADTTKYRLLDTMRSYGRSLLESEDETGEVATRLADHYLSNMGPWMPPDRSWANRVASELDNLRSLIGLLPPERQETAQQIACVLGRYHGDARQTYIEGIEEVSSFVDELPQPSPTRVSLLTTLAFLQLRGGEVDAAARLVDQASEMRDEVGEPEWDEATVERARGEIARRGGDFEEAVTIARRALTSDLGERGRSRMYNLLGTSAGALGDMETAKEAFLNELELNRSLGYEAYVASALGNLAEVAMRQGDYEAAASYQIECFEQAIAIGSVTVLAFSMIAAARLSGHREDWTTAVRLHAKGEQLLEETGLKLYDDDRRQSDLLLGRAQDELGDEEFETADQLGAEMDISIAIDLTRSELAASRPSPIE